MNFNIEREVYRERLKEELKKYIVVQDTKNSLILNEKLDESGLVAHNIWYKNTNVSKDDQVERLEIVADLTKDFEFYVKTEVFGEITEEFGEVTTEKASWYVVYKNDKEILDKYLSSNNVFLLYLALEKREDLMLRRESKYIIRSKYTGNGTDDVVDSKFKRIGGVSSSCVSLDEIFKEAKEEIERPSHRR